MARNNEIFFEVFTKQINIELDKCYSPTQADQKDYLGISENTVALAQAGLFFAGIASAPFTFGLGLGAAGAGIIVLKAGKLCLDAYQDYKQGSQQLPASYLENQRNLQRLALFLLLRQAAFAIAMRYRYALEKTLEKDSIPKFGKYVAYRLMKKLYAELNNNPYQLPTVDSLIDYFWPCCKKYRDVKKANFGQNSAVNIK